MIREIASYIKKMASGSWVNIVFVGLLVCQVLAFKYVGVVGLAVLPALLMMFLFLGGLLRAPYIGLLALYFINYFIMGTTRYVSLPTAGLLIDAMFALIFIAMIINSYFYILQWKAAINLLTWCALLWMGYEILQLVNPLAPSRLAWFYVVRGIAFHFLATVVIVPVLFNRYRDLRVFLLLWAIFTWLGVLKGFAQYKFGFDSGEWEWLNNGYAKTHLIASGIRYFSFFTDAGQFGASMAHSGVVFCILALFKSSQRVRIFYLLTGLAAFYGMLLSGTRGAIAVPAAGFMLYLVLSKRSVTIAFGIVMLLAVFCFLKFTTIGDSNRQIYRIRTALDPKEPSLMVRKKNQAKFADYLKDKPFGGGMGSVADWGKRFSPGTFLSEMPTDSWYVGIWAEQGIVGLMVYLSIMLTIFIQSARIVMFKIKSKLLKNRLSALLAGNIGIYAAAYGNPIIGQFPIGILVYSSFAFIFIYAYLESGAEEMESKIE